MSADDILGTLEARAPRRLLEDLSVIARALAANDRQRPEIEVQLTSGAQIRGRIVSVTEDRAGAVALLYVGGQPRSPSVSFVRIDQIAAVTVIDASLLVRPPISELPTPSGLELKRQLLTWVVPYHDGAIKAFKEAGVWKAEQEKHQAALLKRQGVLQTAFTGMVKSNPPEDKDAFNKAWQTVRAAALRKAGMDVIFE